MTSTQPENVLVIPRSVFSEQSDFTGFRKKEQAVESLRYFLNPPPGSRASFIPRDTAETNPMYKQIIPYIALMSDDQVFLYQRGEVGSEERLHGKYTIGLGGHINDKDHPAPYNAFILGAQRELNEEVGLDVKTEDIVESVHGLINDDSTAVSAVHLGVAMVVHIPKSQREAIIAKAESCMLNAQWIPFYELENRELQRGMESWSLVFAQALLDESCVNAKWQDAAFRERVGLLSVAAANLAGAASGFLMQESPRAHMMSKQMVEEAAGETQCMLAGLIANKDVDGKRVKAEAQDFHSELANMVKHQPIVEKVEIVKLNEHQKQGGSSGRSDEAGREDTKTS